MTGLQNDSIAETFRRYATCDICDALDAVGLRNQAALGILPLWEGAGRIAGRAMTMQLAPMREGLRSVTIGTVEAIQAASPGDILVCNNEGRTDINSVGSLVAFCCIRAGLGGVVTDGAARDIDDIRGQGLPVFAKGAVPTSIRHRTGYVGCGDPITLSGITVNRGDYIVADSSGVVVVPAARAEEIATLVPRYAQLELTIRQRLIQGMDWVKAHDVYDGFKG